MMDSMQRFAREEQRRARVPKPLQRLLLRLIVGRSVLGRGLLARAGGGTPGDSVVVGSVTCADGPTKFAQEFTGRPRTLEAFRALVHRAGWEVASVITRPFAYNVSLKRAS